MANVTAPLLSLGASGMVGPICYQKGRKSHRVIVPRPGQQPDSDAQLRVRANFAQCCHLWNAESQYMRDYWLRKTNLYGDRGKDNFMHIGLQRMVKGLFHPRQITYGYPWPYRNYDDQYYFNAISMDPTRYPSYANQSILLEPVSTSFTSAPFPYHNAWNIDGNLDRAATAPLLHSMTPPAFTLVAFVYCKDKSSHAWFGAFYSPSKQVIMFGQVPFWYTGNYNFRLDTTTTGYFLYDDAPPQDQWAYYCITWDPPDLVMYRDNIQITTNTTAGTCLPVTERFCLGQHFYTGVSPSRPALNPFANFLFLAASYPSLRTPWR